MSAIDERLVALRRLMKKKGVDALIVPSSDPHQSEYVADHWKCREWISGFTGSAGTAVILADYAGLWTDSRYFIQAEDQLRNSGFVLHKVLNYNPDFIAFLITRLGPKSVVACHGAVFSYSEIRNMQEELASGGIDMVMEHDLIGEVWTERPPVPLNKVMIHPEKYTGKPVSEKLDAVRKIMKQEGADFYFIPALDDIAWLFNLRGNDIPCNPVFVSYAILGIENTWLFIEAEKLEEPVVKHLTLAGVKILGYHQIEHHLSNIDKNHKLYLTSSGVNFNLYNSIACELMDGKNRIAALKALKTESEIAHYRNAMEKDGVALTRLYRWLENELKHRTVSECELAEKLAGFRAEQADYVGESFDAIVGYGPNGAIVHYKPEKETCAEILPKGILLLDSGGQYLDGTTDITRTTALSPPTDEQKRDFTLVLKGHIAVDELEFPEGTNGYQLDTFARQYLWKYGINYFHGTGHGVGYFLNVHEGPQGISFVWSERSRTPLAPGMVTSNEPGYYKEGEYGIRIENLMVTRKIQETDFGTFLGHDTLTLFPIDLELIDTSLLNGSEIKWINQYHERVYNRLSERLTESEQKWMKHKCRPIR